jgi:hypothetical protein
MSAIPRSTVVRSEIWKSDIDYDSKKEKNTERASLSIENREPRSLSKIEGLSSLIPKASLSIEIESLARSLSKSRASLAL